MKLKKIRTKQEWLHFEEYVTPSEYQKLNDFQFFKS